MLGVVYKKASVWREKNMAKEEGPQGQAEKHCKMGDSLCVKTPGKLHSKVGAVSGCTLPQHVRKELRQPATAHLTPVVAMPSPKDNG